MQYHRIIEQLRLEGTSGTHLIQPLAQVKSNWTGLLGALPSQVLTVLRDGNYVSGPLLQSFITFMVNSLFLHLTKISNVTTCIFLSFVIPLCASEKSPSSPQPLIFVDGSKIPSPPSLLRLNKTIFLSLCLYVSALEAILLASAGLVPVCQHPFCTRKLQTRDNTPDVEGITAALVHMATLLPL